MTTRTLHTLIRGLFAAFLALALTAPAVAAADPPGRVGRIAWMSGTVQLRNADTGEWNAAVRNYPLTNGDALSTGPGARLEIGIGSTTVRLDSASELSIDQIDDERVRLYLTNGSAIVRLRSRESAREFELATRDGRFTTQDVGAFRFDHAQNISSATPYLGTLHFTAEDSELDIPNGKRAQFWYSGSTAYSFSSPERDDFSEWSIARDQRQDTRSTRRYVSQEMTGYEDLAGHGDWYDSTDYGPVWYPSVVSAGWAPYRSGHWAWVSPWGWTWIDDAPWGFAPFHYGRWVWHRDRWGWAPGRHVARPVYAPALVAWIGTPNVTVRVAGGPSVGWFPLAPREVYVPGYRCSPTYVRNVNVTHVTHIENVTQIINEPHRVMERTHFANRRLPQAVTVVASEVVTQRRPVAPAVENHRNPRFLDAVSRQPSLALAPVAAPALPPRVDINRQERERRGDNPRDRRPDGERPSHDRPNERRSPAPGAAPLPAPVNANVVPATVPPARGLPPPDNRRTRGENARDDQGRPPENGPNANPRFNRPPPQAPAATAPGGAPAAAVTAPPASQPASQPVPPPASAPLPNPRRPAAEPPGEHRRRPEPTPSADPRSDRPASPAPANLPTVVAPSAPAPSAAPPPVPDNRRATPEAPPTANPRFNRPPTPTPAVAPAAPAPAIPASVAPPVEPPRASQPLPPSRRPPGEPPAGEPRRAIDPPPHANPRPERPPQAMQPAPAAMPQPAPAQPPRRAEEREQHSPPPVPRPAQRSEPMPAAQHQPAPPPPRSQPMPPREAPPAPPPPAQHPRTAERVAPPPAPSAPPPNNPRHRDDGDRNNPGNRDEGNRGRDNR
ncbi:MAG: hypothetical protein IPL03_06645 [Sterolibacteriaceae bacterium]|nr:hypothetical protein [Candidatus Methylophosphatis haderslevensis]